MLRIPAWLQRTLERYCRYRGHDVAKFPRAAAAAMAAYFTRDEPFQEWCREHPDAADDAPRTRTPSGQPDATGGRARHRPSRRVIASP